MGAGSWLTHEPDRVTYVPRDPILTRYDDLCRNLEKQTGITPVENRFARELESAVNRNLQFNSCSYDYCWKDSTKDKKGAKAGDHTCGGRKRKGDSAAHTDSAREGGRMMNALNDIRICISPQHGTITIKEQEGLVTNRKEIDQQSLINRFKNSLRTDEQGFSSGFLPLNCLSIWQGNEGKRLCCGTPSSTMWTKAATGTSPDTADCWSLTAIKAD